MLVYITRHALTDGIIEALATITPGDIADTDDHYNGSHRFYPNEWYYTMDDAVDAARRMRDNQLAHLDQQRARLAAMTF